MSCSRNSAPSCSWKRRTQPTRSDGRWRSMLLVFTAGCQRSWPLKSRKSAHTRLTGASMIVLLTTRGTASAPKLTLERIETTLEYGGTDVGHKLRLALGRAVELGGPLQEGALAVGDGREPERCDVVLHRHGRFQDRVGAEHVVIRQAQ